MTSSIEFPKSNVISNDFICIKCTRTSIHMRKCSNCHSLECRQCYNGICSECSLNTLSNYFLNSLTCNEWESMLLAYREHKLKCVNKEIHAIMPTIQRQNLNKIDSNSNEYRYPSLEGTPNTTSIPSDTNFKSNVTKEEISSSISEVHPNPEVNCIPSMTQNLELITSCSKDGKINLIETDSLSTLQTISIDYLQIFNMVYIGNGQVACTVSDNTIQVYKLDSGKLLNSFKGHSSTITQLVHLNNGLIGSVDIKNSVIIWKSDTNETLKSFNSEHNGPVNAFIDLYNGMLATGSADSKIKLRKVKTGKLILTLQGHTGSVNCLTTISNKLIASGSDDATVRIWGIQTGMQVKVIHTGRVTSLLNINNRSIAVGIRNSIYIINSETGGIIKTLEENVGFVNTMVSLKNGVLAISGDDGLIKLWKIDSATVIKASQMHKKSITSLLNVK